VQYDESSSPLYRKILSRVSICQGLFEQEVMIGCEFDTVDIVSYIDRPSADETEILFIKSTPLSSCLNPGFVVFDLLRNDYYLGSFSPIKNYVIS
jgi:hypothetical protein